MEILNEIPITEPSFLIDMISEILLFFGFFNIVFWFIVGVCSELVSTKITKIFLIIGTVSVILGIIGLIISENYFQKPTGKYQYEVVIDDSVSFNEVMEKYKVISQRGEIYVLEEK